MQHQIEFRALRLERDRLEPQTWQLQLGQRNIVKYQLDLKDRAVKPAALGTKRLDKLFKREVLVIIGAERDVPHARRAFD